MQPNMGIARNHHKPSNNCADFPLSDTDILTDLILIATE